jgi:hypothetical protein
LDRSEAILSAERILSRAINGHRLRLGSEATGLSDERALADEP